jgi:predicted phage tail protein
MTADGRRMVEVKLIGELGRRFGRKYRFMARNAREVISALANQLDGFADYFTTAHENGVGFKLITDRPEGIIYEEVMMSCDSLVIAPVVTGSGSNVGNILVGVLLIGLAFVPFGGAFAGLAAAGAKAGALVGSSVLFSLGASLVLTGIAGLLSPPVQTPTGDSQKKDSFMFDRAVELTTQGYPVPLLYGEYLAVSPLYISSAISTESIPV